MALPLSCFPSFEVSNKRTIREIKENLEEGNNEMRVFNQGVSYPIIDLHKKSILKPKVSNGKAQDSFIEKPVNHWKKVFLLACSSGFGNALNYLASADSNSPTGNTFGKKAAKFLALFILYIAHFVMGLYYQMHPYSKLTDKELCQEFCQYNDEDDLFAAHAWHPKFDKCAIALSNNDVYIYSSDRNQSQLIKHPCQKKITALAWKPNNVNVLAIACQHLILIWDLDLLESIKHGLNDSVQIIKDGLPNPITSIDYNLTGEWLAVCGPRSAKIVLLKLVENVVETKKVYCFNTGFTTIKWSPDDSRLMASTTGKFIRVFETFNWSSLKFAQDLNDICQCACWSLPGGRFLLLAMKNDTKIYALPFYEKAKPGDVGRFSNRCEAVLDVSEVTLENGIKVGGRVNQMVWDQNGQRLVISFKDNPQYLALFYTSTKSVLQFSEIGFIHGLKDERPVLISFHDNFRHGSLLSICWSSQFVSYIPLQYDPKEARNTSIVNGTPRSLSNFSVSLPKSRRDSNMSPYKTRDLVLSPREPTLFSVIHQNPTQHGFIMT